MRSSSPRRSGAAPVATLGAAIGALALIHWWAFRPGIIVWDSIRQYGQAVSGHYDDWHPPAMNWLWHELLAFGDGPEPMLVVQIALYWVGIGLLALGAIRRCRWLLAVAIVALALMPMFLLLIGTILKDSLMAGCLLTVAGILAVRPTPPLMARAAVAVLLIGAASLRFNAMPAILPLALAAWPPAWIETRPRLIATGIALAVALLAVMPVANRLLDAKGSGVEYSLITYDLAGITYYSGTNVFPPMPPVTDPRATNSDCYTSVSWDRYAWWGDAPCAIGFDTMRAAFAANKQGPTRWWLMAIVHHPIAYAEHRFGHFNRNIRLWTKDSDLPSLSIRSDPNDWHFATVPTSLSISIDRLAGRSESSPIGWPACWIALGLAVMFLWQDAGDRMIGNPLLWSGLFYALSYLPLSVASEVRYHLWTMLALGIGSLQAIDAGRGSSGFGWRLVGTATMVAAVAGLCIAAR